MSSTQTLILQVLNEEGRLEFGDLFREVETLAGLVLNDQTVYEVLEGLVESSQVTESYGQDEDRDTGLTFYSVNS